jgi:hypothetical protein
MIANVSLLALGTFSRRSHQEGRFEVEKKIRSYLKNKLSQSNDIKEQINLIDAVGNSGDESFQDEIKNYLSAERPEIRSVSVRALRRMAPSKIEPTLVEALQRETHPEVRIALAETFMGLNIKSPGALKAGAQALKGESTSRTQFALVSWLGKSKNDPIAREALLKTFHSNASLEVKQHIGRFLTAKELSKH